MDDRDIHALALSKESNVIDVATLKTGKRQSFYQTTEKVGINFGVKQDSFDKYDIKDNKNESKSTVNDGVDSLLDLDFADKKDVGVRTDNNLPASASDYADVEAMLCHRAQCRGSSLLATINGII